MHSSRSQRALAAAGLSLIVCYFLYFAHDGLRAYFTGDDVMNLLVMHRYFSKSLFKTLLDVLLPFSSAYRPLGGLFYRSIYAAVGFDPTPFRYACFGLLVLNLVITYLVFRRLAGSMEVALLGAMAQAYHAEMSELYFNTGMVYDILCYSFFLLALLLYVRHRDPEGGLKLPWLAALLLLQLLALESKEMACTLPGILLLYEACYGRPRPRSMAAAIATGVLSVLFLLPRLFGHEALAVNASYHWSLSIGSYLRECARYQGMLFYHPAWFGPATLLGFWCILGGLAYLLRCRTMAFGLGFWILTLFPIAVISGRGGFVLYLPAMGLALYAAAFLVRMREALAGFRTGLLRPASQVALFAMLFTGLAVAHARPRAIRRPMILQLHQRYSDWVTSIRSLHPTLKKQAHLLITGDPFPEWELYPVFSLRLLYNDPDLVLDRGKERRGRSYDFVLRDQDGVITESAGRLTPCSTDPAPFGEIDDSSSRICWQGDWLSEGFAAAFQGTITYTDERDATATLVFEGTGLKWVYTRAYNRGRAQVTIDGVVRGVVDLYDPVIQWQAFSEFTGLAPGEHQVVVRVLHEHAPAASDSFVDIDAFEIQK